MSCTSCSSGAVLRYVQHLLLHLALHLLHVLHLLHNPHLLLHVLHPLLHPVLYLLLHYVLHLLLHVLLHVLHLLLHHVLLHVLLHDLHLLQARAGRPRRVVLGDITSQRNLPRAVGGKAGLARQASRRIAKEKVEQPAAIVTNSW